MLNVKVEGSYNYCNAIINDHFEQNNNFTNICNKNDLSQSITIKKEKKAVSSEYISSSNNVEHPSDNNNNMSDSNTNSLSQSVTEKR